MVICGCAGDGVVTVLGGVGFDESDFCYGGCVVYDDFIGDFPSVQRVLGVYAVDGEAVCAFGS